MRIDLSPAFSRAIVLMAILLQCVSSTRGQATQPFHDWAPAPPMGWNSWDCFGAGVNQEQTLANADYMAEHLKQHGWNIVTIDIQWYEPLAHTDQYRKNAVLEMDGNGRLLPAANRFPLTKDSRSFKPIADYLHGKDLKFGLHLLRGIPRQAVVQNVPILGTENSRAADIANTNDTCAWNGDMYGVDMSKPGAQSYYDSVFALLASWEIDLVKVDDLSRPYHAAEIEAIRKAIDKTGRPIIFSTSPGATPLEQGEHVAAHANMWRISDDFWDNWNALYEQFARLDRWTPYRGPGHFPDADMLPLGNIRTWDVKNHWTGFTHDEQITMMTLWCIARSPLIIGANLPANDDFTLSLLTNDDVLAVNQKSTNNRQAIARNGHIVWIADAADSQDKYVAIFNADPPAASQRRSRHATNTTQAASTQPVAITISLEEIGLDHTSWRVRDLWQHLDLPEVKDELRAKVNPHGAVLYRLSPQVVSARGAPERLSYTPMPVIHGDGTRTTYEPVTVVPISQDLRDRYELNAFYTKCTLYNGIPIVGSDKVSDYAFLECAYTLDHLLHDRAMAHDALVRSRVRVGIIASREFTMDIPENQTPDMMARGAYNDERSRGLGGLPWVTCAEENLLNLPSDPYRVENITIHEFTHTVAAAIREQNPAWYDKLIDVYRQAKENGLYGKSYAATDEQEYWAEGAQCWFDCANPRNAGGAANREQLKAKDPALAALLTEVYGDGSWRYVRTTQRSADEVPHLFQIDRTMIPPFVLTDSPRIQGAIKAGTWSKDRHRGASTQAAPPPSTRSSDN